MLKRITAIIAALGIIAGLIPAALAADINIYTNETFENYPLNSETFDEISAVGGVDTRVVGEGIKGKAFYSKLWASGVTASVQPRTNGENVIMSAALKIDGAKTNGRLFNITDSTGKSLSLIALDGAKLSLYDGRTIGTYTDNKWFTVALAVNFEKQYVNVYVDGQMQISHWYLPEKIKNIDKAEFKILAPEGGQEEYTELWIDNLHIYNANEPQPESLFDTKQANGGILDFTPTESVEGGGGWVSHNVTFDSISGISIANTDNIAELRERSPGDQCYYFERKDNTANLYVDLNISSEQQEQIIGSRAYVISIEIKLDSIDAPIDLFDARSAGAEWSTMGRIAANGDLSFRENSAGTLTFGNWHKIDFVFDNLSAKASCYLDGALKVENVPFDNKFRAILYRFGMQSSGTNMAFSVDNVRMYEGRDPNKEFEKRGNTGAVAASAMETASDATSLVAQGDVVIVPKNGAVLSGGRKTYSEEKPYIVDGVTMMPVRMVSEALGYKVDWNEQTKTVTVNNNIVLTTSDAGFNVGGKDFTAPRAPEIKDGRVYLPLRSLCEDAFGKYVYWEPRGMIVISARPFTLRDSVGVQNINDKIDVLARYMFFERPSGRKIMTDLEQNIGNQHPRVMGTKADMDKMRKNAAENEQAKAMAEETIAYADHLIGYPLNPYVIDYNSDAPNILNIARDNLSRVQYLAIAYELTQDTKYADEAWRVMKNAAEYPDWCDKTHFLGTAELSYAFAIGFDTFYDYFSDEQKSVIKTAVLEKALERGLVAYAGTHSNGYWINGDDNWTAVCPGGLMAAAVAMYDEPEIAETAEKLLPLTVQSFEYIMQLLYPDGAWYESVTYLSYAVMYTAAGLGALCNSNGGNGYGLFDAPGVGKVGRFVIGMHGGVEGAFNYHDGSSGFSAVPGYMWLAKMTGDKSFTGAYMQLRRLLNSYSEPHMNLLWYDPELDTGGITNPLDVYLREAEVGTMRQAWSSSSIWAAVHAGQNGVDHDNLDLGEFILEADGVRWVYDNGADNYSLPGYFSTEGYNIYRKRPEANNCFIINPRSTSRGQNIRCTTTLSDFVTKERGAYMVYDLTNAYLDDAQAVKRGYMLSDDRSTFTVRDEITMTGSNEVYWFLNVAGDIEISGNKVELFENGRKMTIDFASNADNIEITKMAQAPLPTSPKVSGMADDSGKDKLLVKLTCSKSVYLNAKFIPGSCDAEAIEGADAVGDIAGWSIADGAIPEHPKLKQILIDGEPLEGFSPEQNIYTILRYSDNATVPDIKAYSDSGEVEITLPQTIDQNAEIRVKDGQDSGYYVLSFKQTLRSVAPEGYTPIEIKSVRASSEPQQENPIAAAIDGDASTRWAAEGDGEWLEIDLGEVKNFDGLKMAFYLGNQRTTYFDIYVSPDAERYIPLCTGAETSGRSDGEEVYLVCGSGRYIRFVGHGNSEGTFWNSLNEFIPVTAQ